LENVISGIEYLSEAFGIPSKSDCGLFGASLDAY
jgi:hypothetical protein